MSHSIVEKSDFTENQLKSIKRETLAIKHGVTGQYVGQILRGDKEANTDVAKSILEDAKNIIKALGIK